jgi:hypothetical protein
MLVSILSAPVETGCCKVSLLLPSPVDSFAVVIEQDAIKKCRYIVNALLLNGMESKRLLGQTKSFCFHLMML